VTSPIYTLALDAGQTGIRTLLFSDTERHQGEYPGLRTNAELFPQLATVIADALTGVDRSVTLSIGMTGLTAAHSRPAELLTQLPAQVERVFLAHDSVTGFLGSIGVGEGVMTAVGTGVVTLGVGATSIARVDGWGNLIGDAGSAYWIGRAGLEAGMRAYDGRLESTALLALLTDNFSHPEEAYIELQTSDDRVTRIAALAKHIIALADSDSAARDIVEAAGRELAHSAVTAARRTALLDSPESRFSWAGNVMKAPALRDAFIRAITAVIPGADIREPLGEPIDGVALLPSVSETSPIADVIYRAHR
jgi:N-acetylglucosamine kinase-like BadF-type ATPase